MFTQVIIAVFTNIISNSHVWCWNPIWDVCPSAKVDINTAISIVKDRHITAQQRRLLIGRICRPIKIKVSNWRRSSLTITVWRQLADKMVLPINNLWLLQCAAFGEGNPVLLYYMGWVVLMVMVTGLVQNKPKWCRVPVGLHSVISATEHHKRRMVYLSHSALCEYQNRKARDSLCLSMCLSMCLFISLNMLITQKD